MLTGQLPRGAWETPSQIVPGLDKRIDDIVLKTLANTGPGAGGDSGLGPGSRFGLIDNEGTLEVFPPMIDAAARTDVVDAFFASTHFLILKTDGKVTAWDSAYTSKGNGCHG